MTDAFVLSNACRCEHHTGVRCHLADVVVAIQALYRPIDASQAALTPIQASGLLTARATCAPVPRVRMLVEELISYQLPVVGGYGRRRGRRWRRRCSCRGIQQRRLGIRRNGQGLRPRCDVQQVQAEPEQHRQHQQGDTCAGQPLPQPSRALRRFEIQVCASGTSMSDASKTVLVLYERRLPAMAPARPPAGNDGSQIRV